MLRGLRTSEIPRPVTVIPIWAQAREAARLVGHDRLLRALAVAQALAALSAGATSGLLVVLAARRLHTSGGGYGLLLAAIAAGALTGPLLLAQLPGHFARRPTVVFAAFGLRGAVDWVLATVTALPAALAALMCYGIGTSTGNVAFSTVIQSHVADKLRGRIFSAFDLIWQAMRLASLLAGGLLADTIGIRAVYYLGGALMAAAALAGWTSAGSPIPAPRTC